MPKNAELNISFLLYVPWVGKNKKNAFQKNHRIVYLELRTVLNTDPLLTYLWISKTNGKYLITNNRILKAVLLSSQPECNVWFFSFQDKQKFFFSVADLVKGSSPLICKPNEAQRAEKNLFWNAWKHIENDNFIVWFGVRIRIIRTGQHSSTTNSLEYPLGR